MRTKTSFKRMLSILLCCAMLVGLMPMTAFAVSYSGSCGAEGSDVKWSLDTGSGVLTIAGTGAMADYSFGSSPWDTYCESITSVEIGDGVTSIGNYAFRYCGSLSSITIPASVTSIGDNAFDDCSGLTKINVAPDNSRYCDIDGVLMNKDITELIRYPSGKQGSYTVPDSVTSIGVDAFSDCGNLTNITIPDGVTEIARGTFERCYSLTSITIPDSVTRIGEYAFFECSSLTSVTIPDGVVSIGEDAFRLCDNLYVIYNDSDLNIEFGSTDNGYVAYYVKVIVDKSGKKTYVNDDNEYIDTENGFLFKKNNDDYTLIAHFGKEETVTLPSNINGCEYRICKMRGVRNVIIPDGVTSIGEDAFYDCSSLISITISDSVTSIGGSAFSGCSNLTGVTIPVSVTSIGNSAFSGCSSLTDITIPDSVTSIGEEAFASCRSLTGITIPASVTSIGYHTFDGCSGLTRIDVALGNSTYRSIDGVLMNQDGTWLICCPSGRQGSYAVPDGVTYISTYAFDDCSSLISITIPNSVTSIGDGVFSHCSGLTSITIPNGVKSIGDSVFSYCSGLTSITIPDSVTGIGEYAFQGCSSLTSITIPNGVKSIGDSVFSYCSSLTNITIPDSVTGIGNYAFRGCSDLTSITIPDSVTSIGYNAFEDCSSLTSITVPDSVTGIGSSTFRGCSSLTKITIPDSVTYIGSEAFWRCSGLTSITIPDSVTEIGWAAFYSSSNLKDVYYAGTEAQWKKIEIATNNEYLLYATIHYNGTDIDLPKPDPDIPTADYTSVHFLEGWNSDSRCLTFAHNGATELEFYTLADNVDASSIEQFLNKYVLVTHEKGDELFDYTVTAIQPLDSKIGTVTAAGEHSLTIDGTEYPVREDWILMANVGDEILYHISNGTIMGYSALEEKHGILEGWDNTTKRVTIDGVEYPTNYLTDLSFLANLDEYLRKGVYFTTSGSADYCPLLKITDFYYPGGKLEDFDADVYHATWLSKHGNAADVLEIDTPSEILIDNISEDGADLAIDMWRSFELVFDTLDDVTTLHDFAVRPKDVYSALILNALEASVSYDTIASEYEDNLKTFKECLSAFSTFVKTDKGIDLNNDGVFQDVVSRMPGVDVDTYTEKFIGDWYKENHPNISDISKSMKYISKGLKVVGSLEDYAEYCAACVTLMDVSDSMKTVLERAYLKSAEVYGLLGNMTMAFDDCLNMITRSSDEMFAQIENEAVSVVGLSGMKYLVGDVLWGRVTDQIQVSCPELAVLQLGYQTGKTVSNWLCNTDDAAEKYLKMDYITDLESMIDVIYRDLEADFDKNTTPELAQAYLSAMELSFRLRDEDCDAAHNYVDNIHSSALGAINELLGGKDYEGLKTSIRSLQNEYSQSFTIAETNWIGALGDDYPGSGLYEFYESIYEAVPNMKLIKQVTAACPIDVYVYDNANNVVASVVDGRVSCQADDIMIALIGDEKVIRFYNGADYRVEYVGYDTGDMDITITEYDDTEAAVRTVNYYDVPLTNQTTYTLASESETMKPYTLEETSDGTVVEHDYDSMDTTTSHTVKVVSGTLEQNGEIFSETTAQKGETLVISAYVPEGYQFIRWETDAGDAVLRDGNAESTVLIMGDTDIVVTAVMSIPQAISQTAPTAPELESKTYSSVTLKAISPNANGAAVEYSKNNGATWQTSPTFTDLIASTEYSFVARYAETENYKASPASAALKVTTDALVNYVPGDINDDGVVNTKDVTRLLKYISHEDVSVNTDALDVNGDGVVNTKDVTRLLKYISHEDVKIY